MRCGGLGFGAMIDYFLLLQEASDAELIAKFGHGMEMKSIRCDLRGFVEAARDGEFEIRLLHPWLGTEVKMHLIGFERVVAALKARL